MSVHVPMTDEDRKVFTRLMPVKAHARYLAADRADADHAAFLENVRTHVSDPAQRRRYVAVATESRIEVAHAARERDPMATEEVY